MPIVVGVVEARADERHERIREEHLLREPDGDAGRCPRATLSPLDALVRRRRELRHHLAVMDDRPGQQVREERHEQRVVVEARLGRLVAADVDQKRDLREREEADAERQREPELDERVHQSRLRQRRAG